MHASTGLNMGRQGTLAYWLVHMLSFVTGRLDAEGGNLKSDGFYPNARSGAGVPEQGYVDTEFGTLRRGALPGTLMSHAILDSDAPIKAMIVVAGNPLLSIAGQERLRKAFEQLELLIVIDIYPSATAELAARGAAVDRHVRARRPQHRQHRHQRPTVRPVHAGGDRSRWPNADPSGGSPTGSCRSSASRRSSTTRRPIPWAKWRHMLAKGSGLDLADLQADGAPHLLPRPEPGTFFDAQVHTPDGLVDCCPPGFAAAIDRCHRLFAETRQEVSDGRLRLIHRRDAWMHNSWFANVARMKRGGRTTNPLSMHADDAERLGLADGAAVIVSNEHGQVATVVEIDDALMPGVVSMVHGWGHAVSPRLARRPRTPRREPERAVADRRRQLRAAVEPGAHDGHRRRRTAPWHRRRPNRCPSADAMRADDGQPTPMRRTAPASA